VTTRLISRFASLARANRALTPSPLRRGGWGVKGVQTLRRLHVGTPLIPYPFSAREKGARSLASAAQ
jgi:hypothetical protein